MITRWTAGQFARPSGRFADKLIAPWLNRIGRPLNRLALDLLDPRKSDAMLEIGFGGGELLAQLADMAPARIAGVDRSRAMVDRARRRIGLRAELLCARAEKLNLADSGFDKVVSVSVIHFWSPLDPPLAEIARVLRPGGSLTLVFETAESLRRWRGHRHGFQLWSEADVIGAAERAGFALEEKRGGEGRKPDRFVGLRLRKTAQ